MVSISFEEVTTKPPEGWTEGYLGEIVGMGSDTAGDWVDLRIIQHSLENTEARNRLRKAGRVVLFHEGENQPTEDRIEQFLTSVSMANDVLKITGDYVEFEPPKQVQRLRGEQLGESPTIMSLLRVKE